MSAQTATRCMAKVREHLAAELEVDAGRDRATRPASARTSTPTRSTSTSS